MTCFPYIVHCKYCIYEPRAGSGVVRIDPLRFRAGCRTRRLNQALSSLLAYVFLSVSVVLLTMALFTLCYFVSFMC